jgi:hypothetical protein
MKKIFAPLNASYAPLLITSLVLLVAVFVFTTPPVAHATVGGPTYLYNLKYNSADTSVYFVIDSKSGRGCPPILRKISLETFAASTVLSCDQAESLTLEQVNAEIFGAIGNLKDLTQINLQNNGIHIEITKEKEEYLSDDFLLKTNYVADVYQHAEHLGAIRITGCKNDQPFLFGGYAVPGLNKKIIILLSAKSDCMEGGYINEILYPVNGTIEDRSPAGSIQKIDAPLTAEDGTITVYAASNDIDTTVGGNTSGNTSGNTNDNTYTVTPLPQDTTTTAKGLNGDQMTIALIAGAFLILGVALGFFAKK